MLADQQLRGIVHQVGIQFGRNLPAKAAVKGQWCPPVDDLVEIAPPDTGEARMPFGIDFLAGQHGDRIGPQSGIDTFHQAKSV